MKEEQAFAIQVTPRVHMEIDYHLRKRNDPRSLDEVATIALKEWLARQLIDRCDGGYQWKRLLLPDGSKLRMRYRGHWHYAFVQGDLLLYQEKSVTPHSWVKQVAGSVRNPWRDIWFKRGIHEPWTQAAAWREQNDAAPRRPGVERRVLARRSAD